MLDYIMFEKGHTPWNKGKHPQYLQKEKHPMWGGGYRNKYPECVDCGKRCSNPHNLRCRDCYYKHIKKEKPKHLFQRGTKLLDETKHAQWAGDSVGYRGLHIWVRKHLGNPDTCEFCGKSGLKGHAIHWANKDHSYKRNLGDWLRLCSRCHKKYDLENGLSDH